MTEIYNRFTGAVMFSDPSKTVLELAVENKTNLNGANLNGANLAEAILNGASLNGANLIGARLDGASLDRASLAGANLNGANLNGARLDGANLNGANLNGAWLDGANLAEANLTGAILYKANLDRTKGAVFFQTEGYTYIIQEGFITIGCQRHTKEAWAAFSDAEIKKMDGDPILWNKHKTTILSMNV